MLESRSLCLREFFVLFPQINFHVAEDVAVTCVAMSHWTDLKQPVPTDGSPTTEAGGPTTGCPYK